MMQSSSTVVILVSPKTCPEHGGHLGVADLPRVGEGQVGSDDQTGALVELVPEDINVEALSLVAKG